MNKITDSIAIQKLLQQERNTGRGGEMWISISDQIVLTPFKLLKVDLVNRLCWCHIEREDEDFFTIFNSAPEIKCFFPGSGFFIFSRFHSLNQNSKIIKFHMPKYAVPKERRKEERIDLSGQLSLKIKDGAFERTFKIFDISKGGLSIILSKTDHFANPLVNQQLEGSLGPFSLPITLRVASVLKVRPFVLEKIPYAGKKLSFEFVFEDEKKDLRWQNLWPKVVQFID